MSGEIRRAPESNGIVPAEPVQDEHALGGGLLRRLGPGPGSPLIGMWESVEQPFDPSKESARQELQRQRHVGQANPSATDPQGEQAAAEENRVAAPGRRKTPYSGYIVLTLRASLPASLPPEASED